jgi:coenzyme F420-reducing hydrogenase delta subunit
VEKKLLLLHCAEGAKRALHRMTQLGHKLPRDVRTFELPCTGRVNDVLLMETLQDGFDGVLVIGCHKDNCKYLDGNMRAEKRVNHVQKILADAGIEKKYVAMVFVAPDEGARLSGIIQDFYGKMIGD